MTKEQIHEKICVKKNEVEEWFLHKQKGLQFPVYSSFDVRDSHFKVANIDANVFPAGFNNICQMDKDNAVGLVDEYLNTHYGSQYKNVLLLTEEHTKNAFYWENVKTLSNLIEQGGREVRLAIPREFDEPLSVESISGHQMQVYSAKMENDRIRLGEFVPDLVVSNNDFSEAYESWGQQLVTPMNPPRQLGWYQRRKHEFFNHYNQLAFEFCELVEIDPWTFQVTTEIFSGFDANERDSRIKLAEVVDNLIAEIEMEYKKRSIHQRPFAFVKNNSGTYGLGVIRVYSGLDILEWNYKSRKKMKAAKGGGGVDEVIVQEGIPSAIQTANETAEPTIYMIGSELAGGFLRAHEKKGPTESLNSPGAVFKRLCVSDLSINIKGCPLENVYGWAARLGSLAIGLESQSMDIRFQSYIS